MSRRLAVNVTVGRETYPAGSTVSKEIADQIDNPKAWGDEPEAEESTTAKKAPAKKPASGKSE